MAGSPQRDTILQTDITFPLLKTRFLHLLTHFPSRQQKSVVKRRNQPLSAAGYPDVD